MLVSHPPLHHFSFSLLLSGKKNKYLSIREGRGELRNMLEKGKEREIKGERPSRNERRWEVCEREREVERYRGRGDGGEGLSVPVGLSSSVVGPSRLSCLLVSIKALPLTPPANWCNECVSYMGFFRFLFFFACTEEFRYLLDKIFCNCSYFIDRSNMLHFTRADFPTASGGDTALIKRANLPSANLILYLRKF